MKKGLFLCRKSAPTTPPYKEMIMSIKQKKAKLAKLRRQRKIEREIIAIGAGAGWWWLGGDGYVEYQDDAEKCLGRFLQGIQFYFDLPSDCSIFRPWQFGEFSNPKSAAKAVINEIDFQKYRAKQANEQ